MAYPATNRFNYWGQFGILAGLTGAGLIFGQLVSLIPLLSKVDLKTLTSSKDLAETLFVPANAGVLRVVQFITTLFLFFVPTLFYAWICHKKAFTHLGFRNSVNIKQVVIVIAIMVAAIPLVIILSELTEKLPVSKAVFERFQAAEETYNKQINIIGRMDNFTDYLLSLFMLAFLAAVFEETLFRGAVQNLLSRWWKMPILAIVITSAIFSAVHGSYLGFLNRFVLGFLLGWMYHRTGNLWLNIIAHGFYNGIAVTLLYVAKLNNPNIDLSKTDFKFPMWTALVSLVALYGLFILFEKVNSYQIKQPGQEVLFQVESSSQPSWLQDSGENKSI